MKLTMLSVFLVCLLVQGLQAGGEMVVEYEFPEPTFTRYNGYDVPRLPEVGRASCSGATAPEANRNGCIC